MSTPSKRRRAARAWMHKERAAHDATVSRLEHRHRENLKRAKDDLTRMIPREDDGVFYPQGKLTHPHGRITIAEHPPLIFNPSDYAYYPVDYRIFHLQAVQHALRLPDGTTVVWWGWELK